MSNICHNGRVVYLRQSSATLFARCKSRVLSTSSTAWQVALLCPPMFVCTPSSAQERIIVQNVHGWIAHYCIVLCAQVLCVAGVDTRTSFAFRCLCHLKSTTPFLTSPKRDCAQVKMIWIQENSLLVFSFQIYIWHNIYLAQLCQDHNSSYRFLGLCLFVSMSWSSAAGFYLITLFWHFGVMLKKHLRWLT